MTWHPDGPTLWILAFSESATALTFAWSAVSKALAFHAFATSLETFNVNLRWQRLVAAAVLIAEACVLTLMAGGGLLLALGLVSAVLLLSAFTAALSWSRREGTAASCLCFGSSREMVVGEAIRRNTCLLAFCGPGVVAEALAGWSLTPKPAQVLIAAFPAAVLVVAAVHLPDLNRLFASGRRLLKGA